MFLHGKNCNNKKLETKNRAGTIQFNFTLNDKVDLAVYYLGHLTKGDLKQGLSCKIKEEKGDPTIGGVEQYKASGNIKTYCSQTSFYDQGKVSVQIFSRPSLVFSLSLSLSLSLVVFSLLTIILFSFLSVSFFCSTGRCLANRTLDKLLFSCMLKL